MAEMFEYMGRSGNNYYIANRNFNECMMFDSFGSLVGRVAIGEARNVMRVDLLSVISDGSGVSEVYFRGKKKICTTVSTLMLRKNLLGINKRPLGIVCYMRSVLDGVSVSNSITAYKFEEVTFSDIDAVIDPSGREIWEDL